jgi:hypothetical protein
MRKIIPVLLVLLVGACATPEKRVWRSEDFAAVYEAENTIDTIERLTLKPEGRFEYFFGVIVGEARSYEGRWELRGQTVVLIVQDQDGKDVEEFPLEVLERARGFALNYSQASYAAANPKMLLPDSYSRISKIAPARSKTPINGPNR